MVVLYPTTEDLKELIAQAEAGEIEAAREGLRDFTRRRPSVLLAWKWLADVAGNAKERSEAVRRAQLLAPGDPWVIEAKKHRMPPKRTPKRVQEAMPTRPLDSPISASDPPPIATAGRDPNPDDLTLINRMNRGEALQKAIERSQPPEKPLPIEPEAAELEPEPSLEPQAVVSDDVTLAHIEPDKPAEIASSDETQAMPAIRQPESPVEAPRQEALLQDAATTEENEVEKPAGGNDTLLIVAIAGLAILGIVFLAAAVFAANLF